MISFNNTKNVSLYAMKWLVGFILGLLLLIGSSFRIYLNKNLQRNELWVQDFLSELDQILVYSFWGLLFIGVLFSIVFVRLFFGPLGALIEKASAIRKGDLNIKKSTVIKESRGEWYQLDLSLNKIWKDLKRKKADVEKERSELDAILTAANDAILAVDKDMNIRYYNAPMAMLFEQKEEGNWGKKITEVIRSQSIIEGFQKCIKEKKSQWVHAQHEMTYDGTIRYYKVSISPFFDEKKSKTRGAVAFFHDITDHKKVEKVRMDFVANASHELKTPLTSVQGYLGLIKSLSGENEQIAESFSVVENNLDRLNSIIQDLLELSKIESAESIIMESLNTMELTESVIHDLQGQIKDKKQDLHFHFDSKTVYGNREMIEHVIMNLVENAVKYSPSESQIKIKWGQSGEMNFLSVKDNGPGIESFHQGRLFERFYRVRDEQNQMAKGTGLGLSIVRNCMQKMDGTVDVKSAPGLGSEFICYFPEN